MPNSAVASVRTPEIIFQNYRSFLLAWCVTDPNSPVNIIRNIGMQAE